MSSPAGSGDEKSPEKVAPVRKMVVVPSSSPVYEERKEDGSKAVELPSMEGAPAKAATEGK